jgi:hypothetical protein
MSLGKQAAVWSVVARVVNCAALAYLMVRPVGFNAILLPVLALLAATSMVTIIVRRPKIANPILIVLISLLLAGTYGSIVGFQNPGLMNGVLVWLVAPAIFGTWLLACDARQLKSLLTTAAVTTIAISAAILLFVAGSIGAIPQVFPEWAQTQLGFFFDPTITGGIAIQFLGLSTLVAAAPIWLASIILPRHPLLPRPGLSAAAGLIALVATMVAGRAALTVVTIVVPAIIWTAWRVFSRREPRTLARSLAPVVAVLGVAGVAGVLLLVGNANVTKAFARLLSTFTGEGQSVSDQIRSAQSGELLYAWAQSPVFGHGLGAVIEGYARSKDRPWDFELQYHLYLFQFGVVGVLILLVGVGAAIWAFITALRVTPEMAPVLFVTAAGATAMLSANASNPYLQAPGHMWAVYLLLVVTNIVLTKSYALATPADVSQSIVPESQPRPTGENALGGSVVVEPGGRDQHKIP